MLEFWNDIKDQPVSPILAFALVGLEAMLCYLVVSLRHGRKKNTGKKVEPPKEKPL